VVSSNYFDTLGVPLAAGRTFTREEERPGSHSQVAIATYARWKAAGLDPSFLGSVIRINARDYTVVGVAPDGFTGTMALLSPDVFLPLGVFDVVVDDRFKNNGHGLGDRSNAGLVLVGRLRPGLDAADAQSALEALSRDLETAYPADNKNQVLSVGTLSRLSVSPGPTNNAAIVTAGAFLMTLSGIVLLVACLNIANMLLARGTSRRKELAVRLALGAGRARVIRQLLTESLLLAVAGAAFGLVLSYWATHALAVSLAAALPFTLTVDAGPNVPVLLATMAFTTVGTLAFGLGPALTLSRRDVMADLKDRGGDGSSGRRFGARNLMVIGQVALSLALLTGGGLFVRPAFKAADGNPGYSYDRLLVASVNTTLAGLNEPQGRLAYGEVLDRVRAMPGVTAASFASSVPFGDSVEGRLIEQVGASGAEPARARAYRIIGADYFTTLGLTMIRGRDFTMGEERSASAPRVAIVDQVMARRLFGDADPIGRMIRTVRETGELESPAGEPMEIVGIAPPLREELLDRAPVPHVYVPFGRDSRARMHVEVRLAPGVDPSAAAESLRQAIRSANAQLPILTLSTMQALHDNSIELWALMSGARLFAGLGLLAALLASIGIYGVKSYTVARRTREIGIRMALGASSHQVLMMILRDSFFLAGMGLAAGLPLAALVSIGFRSVFVEIGGVDVAILMVATLALGATALLAGAVPARRATKIQPLTALRAD
jgi:predicted permease